VLLTNINTASTDCCGLVLVARLIYPDTEKEVLDFVRLRYPNNALCDQNKFTKVWHTEIKHMPYAKTHLLQIVRVGVSAHVFIRSSIPSIMKSMVFSYSQKDYTKLQFTLDTPPLFTTEHSVKTVTRAKFELRYDTGEIVGLNKQGILHTIYGRKVRAYCSQPGGVFSMKTLLYDENIGSIMRYDKGVESWRLYDAKTGIWACSENNDDVRAASVFLNQILRPIASLVDFLGAAQFDWVSGWVTGSASASVTPLQKQYPRTTAMTVKIPTPPSKRSRKGWSNRRRQESILYESCKLQSRRLLSLQNTWWRC